MVARWSWGGVVQFPVDNRFSGVFLSFSGIQAMQIGTRSTSECCFFLITRALKLSRTLFKKKRFQYSNANKQTLFFYSLRTFAPTATAHLYCAHHSLSTHVPRHFQAHALSRKLNKNIEAVTLALTWCANIFVGCSVTPNFFPADHFLFRFSPLY